MKRARFSEEQIITILKEAEGGAKVAELCRRHGISDATFYTWRSKYGELEISEMRPLWQVNHKRVAGCIGKKGCRCEDAVRRRRRRKAPEPSTRTPYCLDLTRVLLDS